MTNTNGNTAQWLNLMANMKVTQLRVQERVLLGQPQHSTDKDIGARINALAQRCVLLQKQ